MLTTILLLCLVSFLAGLVDSISGGGGLLQISALLLAGQPPKVALATDKFIAAINTIPSLYTYIKHKKVIWKLALYGIVFSLLGSFIGSKLILSIPNEIVGKIIVFLLPVALVLVLLPKKNVKEKSEDFSKLDLFFKVPVICLLVGFYAGFFGAGTGSLFIIALYTFLGLNLVHASASTKVFSIVANIGAVTVFLLIGQINFQLAIPMTAAGLLGSYLGSKIVVRKGVGVVRLFLILTLTCLGISLIWKYFIH